VLGVDLGERRIGLALSDPTGTLASPLRTIEVSGDPDRDRLAVDNSTSYIPVALASVAVAA